jgi:phosphopantetheinyl transferase
LLVGNDLVDLRDPENQPTAIHRRFDERVFTPAEHARLRIQATAHRTRWRMWAAKESAFKVARKLDPRVRFLPRLFSVQPTGTAGAVVRHASGRFEVSFLGADDWVHAIATLSPASGIEAFRRGPAAMVERVQQGKSAALNASERVRALARSAIGSALSIAPSEIRITSADGVPVAFWKRSPLPIDLSLSHHGRYVACAWGWSPAVLHASAVSTRG